MMLIQHKSFQLNPLKYPKMWYICKAFIYISYCFAGWNHILFRVFILQFFKCPVFIKDFYYLSYLLQIINSFIEMLREKEVISEH